MKLRMYEENCAVFLVRNSLRSSVNRRGVTLIELVVVMVIIAFAAILLIPNIGAWIPRYRLRTSTRDIVSLMRVAQMEAVSQNTPHRVCFAATDGSYVSQRRTTTGLWIDEEVAQRLPPGIRFHEINLVESTAQFNPNNTASGGNITLSDRRGNQKKITLMSVTGRVKIE
jgi:prepilin-type N-terminal cleavage/methylation domain-containing protein